MTIHMPEFKCKECKHPYTPFNYENASCPSCGYSDGSTKEDMTVVPGLVEDAKYNLKFGGMALMTMTDKYIAHAMIAINTFKKIGDILPTDETALDTLCETIIEQSKVQFPEQGTWKTHIQSFTREVLKHYDKNREDPAFSMDDVFMG